MINVLGYQYHSILKDHITLSSRLKKQYLFVLF